MYDIQMYCEFCGIEKNFIARNPTAGDLFYNFLKAAVKQYKNINVSFEIKIKLIW